MNDLLFTLAMAALGQFGGPVMGPGPGMGVPPGLMPVMGGGIGPGIRIGIIGPGVGRIPIGIGGYGSPVQGYPRRPYPAPGYPGQSYPIGAYPYPGAITPRNGFGPPVIPYGMAGPGAIQPRLPQLRDGAPPSSEAEAFGLAPYR